MMNLLSILKSYDALEKVLKEAVGDVDESYPIPNMAGKSVYYSRPPREGQPMPLAAFKGEFSRKYVDANGKEKIMRGKNNTMPFGKPITPINGYYYYICGLYSNPEINFSIKAPAKWVAPMHGAGTNWAEGNYAVFDRKLKDFAMWQFGAKDPYIIKKVPLEVAQENNFEWLEKPLPDESGYVFAKDLSNIESRGLPKHQKAIGTIENRGKGTIEIIRKEPRRKSDAVFTRGLSSKVATSEEPSTISSKDFFVMPDGRKVYKDGRVEDKYGNLIKGPSVTQKQSAIDKKLSKVVTPKDFKGKLRQYGETKRFDDINHLMRFIAIEVESTKNRAYNVQDIDYAHKRTTESGREYGPMFDKDVTRRGIEVGFGHTGADAADATAARLKAKYSNTISTMLKKARENYIAKHGQEGINYLMSPEGQRAIQRFVTNKLAIKIADSDGMIG